MNYIEGYLWSWRRGQYSIVVAAPTREDAQKVIERFLTDRGDTSIDVYNLDIKKTNSVGTRLLLLATPELPPVSAWSIMR